MCRLSKRLKIESDSLEIRKYIIIGKLNGMTFGVIENTNAPNDSIVFSRNFLLINTKRYLSEREPQVLKSADSGKRRMLPKSHLQLSNTEARGRF